MPATLNLLTLTIMPIFNQHVPRGRRPFCETISASVEYAKPTANNNQSNHL
jgi:hypothetical protein